MFHRAKCRNYEFPYIFFKDNGDLDKFTSFLENFDKKIDVPITFCPIGSPSDTNHFRNIDLECLRKNKYIYENEYDNIN